MLELFAETVLRSQQIAPEGANRFYSALFSPFLGVFQYPLSPIIMVTISILAELK